MQVPRDAQQRINVDISKTKDVLCLNCESPYFKKLLRLKHMSPILSPTGEAMLIPVEVLVCERCGEEFDPEKSLSSVEGSIDENNKEDEQKDGTSGTVVSIE